MQDTYRFFKYSDNVAKALDEYRAKHPEKFKRPILPPIIATEPAKPATFNDFINEYYHKHAFDGPVSHDTEDLEEWANGD